MTDERWTELMEDNNAKLTQEEKDDGWYFSDEFDGLLVKEGSEEDLCTRTME